MKSQLSLLEPLILWSAKIIRIGREEGHFNKEIIEWIKAYGKEGGWQDSQINKALRYNGILESQKDHNPVLVICPKCNTVGRLNSYSPNRNGKLDYYIAHEPAKGTWGKTHRERYRRCYYHNLTTQNSQWKYYKDIVRQIQESCDVKTNRGWKYD